jgi:hypothetical protein
MTLSAINNIQQHEALFCRYCSVTHISLYVFLITFVFWRDCVHKWRSDVHVVAGTAIGVYTQSGCDVSGDSPYQLGHDDFRRTMDECVARMQVFSLCRVSAWAGTFSRSPMLDVFFKKKYTLGHRVAALPFTSTRDLMCRMCQNTNRTFEDSIYYVKRTEK